MIATCFNESSRLRRGIIGAWLTAAVLVLAGTASSAPVYDVRFAAVTGDPVGDQVLSVVADQIVTNNDRGEVVLGGRGLVRAVVDSSGQRLLSPVPVGDPQLNGERLTGVWDQSLNDLGQVAFQGLFGGHTGVVFDGRVLVSTLNEVRGSPITRFWGVMLNNRGQVVVSADYGGGGAILVDDHIIVASGDTIDEFTIRDLSMWPAINDSGTIAFRGQWATGSGIFTSERKIAAEGDTIDGYELLLPYNGVAINNTGDVVFLARFAGGYGLFSEHELLVRTGDVIDGHTITFISQRAAMNDVGEIVFTAQYDDGKFGIFTRDTLIASIGDVVDGRELWSVGQSSMGRTRWPSITAAKLRSFRFSTAPAPPPGFCWRRQSRSRQVPHWLL